MKLKNRLTNRFDTIEVENGRLFAYTDGGIMEYKSFIDLFEDYEDIGTPRSGIVAKKKRAFVDLLDKGIVFHKWSINKDGDARIVIEASCASGIAKELDILCGGEK